ncbi:MAG: hypothetical protein LBI69_01475 [Puniceicoccales bacterium]|jgi:hypothetical protein|nr:hypothetical protein [Puniceicoccales bacterium]
MSISAIQLYSDRLHRQQIALEGRIFSATGKPSDEDQNRYDAICTSCNQSQALIVMLDSIKNYNLPSASSVALSAALWMAASPDKRSIMWQHVEEAVEEVKEQNKELGQLKFELEKAAADLANANAKLVEAKVEGEKKRADAEVAAKERLSKAEVDAKERLSKAEANAQERLSKAEADAQTKLADAKIELEDKRADAEARAAQVRANADAEATRRRAMYDTQNWFSRTFIGFNGENK